LMTIIERSLLIFSMPKLNCVWHFLKAIMQNKGRFLRQILHASNAPKFVHLQGAGYVGIAYFN
jgi:hypothetical protein